MTIPGDDLHSPDLAELRGLLRQVTRGLRGRRRPPGELSPHLLGDPPLGPRHFAVLAHLAADGERTVGELASDLGLSLPAASKLTTELEEHALVHRREHSDDRRRTVVDLNSLTADQVNAWLNQRNRPLEQALATLAPAEREAFLKGLRALAAALMEESDCGSLRSHHRTPHRRRPHRDRPV